MSQQRPTTAEATIPSELLYVLAPGEEILWWGRPRPTNVISTNSLCLLGLALFFCFVAAANLIFAPLPLLFAGVFFWGIFSTAGYQRRTAYAVTGVRVAKYIAGAKPRLSQAPLSAIQSFQVLGGKSGRPTTVVLFISPGPGVALRADPSLVSGTPNPMFIRGIGLGTNRSGGGAATPARITLSRIDDPTPLLAILDRDHPRR